MTGTIKKKLGVLRSIAMYYWKPFNKRRLTKFYANFINENSLCFDIGAHLGNRTNAWRALGAKVIAVDPQPQCLAFLRQKFGKDKGVIILPKAVSDKSGKANLHISQLTPTISTLADKDWQKKMNDATSFEVNWEETIEVEVVTLDQLIAEYGIPDFCKIDVEDLEVQVLKGLTQPIPCLSLEYFVPTLERVYECIDQLTTLGDYEYNWSFGESQVMNSEAWLSADAMKAVFDEYTQADPSGDIYARLVKRGG